MALIEGVGDEVTLLFAVVIFLFVLALAWVSTHTTDRLTTHWGPSVSQPEGTPLNSHPSHPSANPTQSNRRPSTASDPTQSNREASPASDPTQSNREASPASDPTQSNREASPASDCTQSNREASPASDPTQSNREASPASDPTQSNREPSPASDPTQSNKEPSPASDPTQSNREASPASDPTQSNREASPASDPTQSNREPSPASDPTQSNREPSLASDPTHSNREASPASDPTHSNREPSPASDHNGNNSITESPSAVRESRYDSEPILSNDDAPPNTLRHRRPTNGPERDSPEASGTIVLRLKFLNDTERLLTVRPSDTVRHIKQTYFPGQEDRVRLIYQGQLLRDDSQTVSALQLRDGCVLHCHISQHASGQGPHGPELVPVPLNIGSLLVPLLGLILMLLWYYKIQYPYAFTATATACLGGVTLLVGVMAVSSYRR